LFEELEDGSIQEFFFSGVNIYWLGQDENNPEQPDKEVVYSHPSNFRIDDVLLSSKLMGSTVVRAHTVGVSTGTGEFHAWNMGWEGVVWPTRGVTMEENFASMDYAVLKAGELGIRLIVPLTDEWNYFHGGIHDFLGWRGLSKLEGVEGNCVCNMDQHLQDEFYTNEDVVADFKEYIGVILNHVNPMTGVAYKDDPTIMAWETGNELYYPTVEWTMDIANYIKVGLGAKQLVMDGRMVSRTGFNPELDDPLIAALYSDVVDIVSDHFYPMSVSKLRENSKKSVEQLNLPYVVGEIGWTSQGGQDVNAFMAETESLRSSGFVSGDLFWSMFGHGEKFGQVVHDDGFSIYWPTGPEPASFNYDNTAYRLTVRNISDHMYRMEGRPIPSIYGMDDIPPVVTHLLCRPGFWIQIGVRGVAGAHLYKIVQDGKAIAYIEDRQKKPIYIHNSDVTETSQGLHLHQRQRLARLLQDANHSCSKLVQHVTWLLRMQRCSALHLTPYSLLSAQRRRRRLLAGPPTSFAAVALQDLLLGQTLHLRQDRHQDLHQRQHQDHLLQGANLLCFRPVLLVTWLLRMQRCNALHLTRYSLQSVPHHRRHQ